MKKTLSLLAMAFFLIGFVACNNTATDEAEAEGTEEVMEEAVPAEEVEVEATEEVAPAEGEAVEAEAEMEVEAEGC